MTFSLRNFSIGLILTALSAPSFAHTGHNMQVSFSDGFLHPLTGVDHLAALVLIGFFASSYRYKKSAQIIGCFAAALMMGFFVGVEWSNANQAEWLVSASLVALPIAVYALRKGGAVKWVAMSSIAVFSACHGLVQGAEAIGAVSEFGLGSLIASVLVMSATTMLVKVAKGNVQTPSIVK